VLHVEAKFLYLVEPARKEAVDIALRAQPRDRLVVRPQREVRTNPRWARGAAAQQVVPKHPQGVDHRQQLKNVSGVGLLRSRELAALVRDGVVMAVVIRLGKDRRDRCLAGVCREDRTSARVEGPEDRGRCEAVLQAVETPLLLHPPLPWCVRAAQARERGGNVCVLVDEAAVVVA
jgi:hypothetical protein